MARRVRTLAASYCLNTSHNGEWSNPCPSTRRILQVTLFLSLPTLTYALGYLTTVSTTHSVFFLRKAAREVITMWFHLLTARCLLRNASSVCNCCRFTLSGNERCTFDTSVKVEFIYRLCLSTGALHSYWAY